MIEIRDAVRDDAELLATAHIEGWRVGYRGLLPDEYLDAPSFAQQRMDNWQAWRWGEESPQTQVFTALLDGAVVGFGMCGVERPDPHDNVLAGQSEAGTRGEVFAFYLRPAAWGSGVADELMARCHSYLCGLGFTEAVLWVLRDNPRARGFYERAGWSATGRTSLFEGPQTAATLPFSVTELEYRISFE